MAAIMTHITQLIPCASIGGASQQNLLSIIKFLLLLLFTTYRIYNELAYRK